MSPNTFPPFELTLLRAIFAAALFSTAHLALSREKVEWKDLGLLAVCSLFGITISNVLFFKGISLTSPINGALITLSAPLFLVVFAIILEGEIAVRKLIGIGIGAIGGGFLVIGDTGQIEAPPNPALGNVLIGGSAGAYAVYLMLIKPLLVKYNPLTILRWLFTFGALYLLPFLYDELLAIEFSSFSSTVWIALGFILICITLVTFLLNTFALKVLSPSVVSTYIYTTPLLTAGIGIVANQDAFSINLIFAGIFIIGGGYMVSSGDSAGDEDEDEDEEEDETTTGGLEVSPVGQ